MHTPFHANPTLADVERPYVDEGMGHSQGQSVTDLYIAKYPLEKQMEYNSKLLDIETESSKRDKLLAELSDLSEADLVRLLGTIKKSND